MSIINNQKGIGLIEVIVSLLLLAIATLGFVAMQGSALKLTNEAVERTKSLELMTSIGENIRANPEALETYIEKINLHDTTKPDNDCGLYGENTTVACTNVELAQAQSFAINEKVETSGFSIRIEPCPSSGSSDPLSVMYAQCLISAWGNTTATVGNDTDYSDGAMDCLSDKDGSYHPDATCMLMELT